MTSERPLVFGVLALGLATGACSFVDLGEYDTPCEVEWHGALDEGSPVAAGVAGPVARLSTTELEGSGGTLVLATRGQDLRPVETEGVLVSDTGRRSETWPDDSRRFRDLVVTPLGAGLLAASVRTSGCGRGQLHLAHVDQHDDWPSLLDPAPWRPLGEDGAEACGAPGSNQVAAPAIAGLQDSDGASPVVVVYRADQKVRGVWLDASFFAMAAPPKQDAAFELGDARDPEEAPWDAERGILLPPQIAAFDGEDRRGFVVAYLSAEEDCSGGVRLCELQPQAAEAPCVASHCVEAPGGPVEALDLSVGGDTAMLTLRADGAIWAVTVRLGRSEPLPATDPLSLGAAARVSAGPAADYAPTAPDGSWLIAWVERGVQLRARRVAADAQAAPGVRLAGPAFEITGESTGARGLQLRARDDRAVLALLEGSPGSEILRIGSISCLAQ